MSQTIPWCVASGAAPSARCSRGCQVPAVPDTMAVRGSRGWSLSRGVGLSGRAVVAWSMESTASKLRWLTCGCGMNHIW